MSTISFLKIAQILYIAEIVGLISEAHQAMLKSHGINRGKINIAKNNQAVV